jgi:hypothetical protein
LIAVENADRAARLACIIRVRNPRSWALTHCFRKRVGCALLHGVSRDRRSDVTLNQRRRSRPGVQEQPSFRQRFDKEKFGREISEPLLKILRNSGEFRLRTKSGRIGHSSHAHHHVPTISERQVPVVARPGLDLVSPVFETSGGWSEEIFQICGMRKKAIALPGYQKLKFWPLLSTDCDPVREARRLR